MTVYCFFIRAHRTEVINSCKNQTPTKISKPFSDKDFRSLYSLKYLHYQSFQTINTATTAEVISEDQRVAPEEDQTQ